MYSYRDTRAEISLDAIDSNVKQFKRYVDRSCLFMAVVKADGYGHGAVQVARTAAEAGADYLGVAFVDEALQLRDAGVGLPILALGHTPLRSIEAAVQARIALTVFTEEALDEAAACAKRLGKQAVIHIKFDTGMSRLGMTDTYDCVRLVRRAFASPGVFVEGIFTHFAAADVEEAACTHAQYAKFAQMIAILEREGLHIPLKHCCNSAATLRFPAMHMDMVRVGVSLYGLTPSPAAACADVVLAPAMQFKTSVSALKTIPAGQPVGYGCTFAAEKETVIAVVPVGYADGYPRSLSNRGYVAVRGRRAPIAGRICMDQTMIDVTGVPGVREGDEVVLFGSSGGNELPVDETAALAQTIHYETVCQVGKRVPRVYVRHGRAAGYTNATLDKTAASVPF